MALTGHGSTYTLLKMVPMQQATKGGSPLIEAGNKLGRLCALLALR
jgi:hypothetical protein